MGLFSLCVFFLEFPFYNYWPHFPQIQCFICSRPERLQFFIAQVTPDILVIETGSKIKAMKIGTRFLQIPYSKYRFSTRICLLLFTLQCLQASTFVLYPEFIDVICREFSTVESYSVIPGCRGLSTCILYFMTFP